MFSKYFFRVAVAITISLQCTNIYSGISETLDCGGNSTLGILQALDGVNGYYREVTLDEVEYLHPVPRPGKPEGFIQGIADDLSRNGYNTARPIIAVELPSGKIQPIDGNHRLKAFKEYLPDTTVNMRVIPHKDAEAGLLVLVPEEFPKRLTDREGNKVRYRTALKLGEKYGGIDLDGYEPFPNDAAIRQRSDDLLNYWINDLKILGETGIDLEETN